MKVLIFFSLKKKKKKEVRLSMHSYVTQGDLGPL